MKRIEERLATQVVSREAVALPGASGNPVEHVTLRDGRRLVCKRVAPAHDWISRATGDTGRALWMWEEGLFDRLPVVIDHTVVAVEPIDGGEGWAVFMRDVSESLIQPGRRLDRGEVRRVLAAITELHRTFAGERFPELCGSIDRYNLLSLPTARREAGTPLGDGISRCWEVFADLAPPDVATAVLELAEDPTPLAEQLDQCEPTLVHGDVRLTNLGLPSKSRDDRVVLFDWGERTGSAPGSVDLASFLVFDGRRFAPSLDEVIADFRDLAGCDHDERALQLALVGGLVQLAPNLVLDVVMHGDDERVEAAREDVDWWCATVGRVFETTWAPG